MLLQDLTRQALADAVAEIKKISVDSGCTGGKW